MHGIAPDATPGTGEQTVTEASDGETFRANGEVWHVGSEYWDSELQDLAVLARVIRRSSWCDTRPAEECPPKLVFVRRRGTKGHKSYRIDPNDPSGEVLERFTRRRGQ